MFLVIIVYPTLALFKPFARTSAISVAIPSTNFLLAIDVRTRDFIAPFTFNKFFFAEYALGDGA